MLLAPCWNWAAELPADVRITRIVSFDLLTRRPHHVGYNSYAKEHGVNASERMIRLYTSAGVEGIATSWDTQENCQKVLGRRVSELMTPSMAGWSARSTATRRRTRTWRAKLLGKPVWTSCRRPRTGARAGVRRVHLFRRPDSRARGRVGGGVQATARRGSEGGAPRVQDQDRCSAKLML